MSKVDDGGSAFPIPLDDRPGAYSAEPGMTLRDYFAAHAPTPTVDMTLEEHCAYRYRYADQMIQARQS